jgi:hypothetical protein
MAATPLVHSAEEVGTNWHRVKAIPGRADASDKQQGTDRKPTRASNKFTILLQSMLPLITFVSGSRE